MRFITSFISLALLAANAVSAFGQTAYGFMMGDRAKERVQYAQTKVMIG